MTPTNPKTASAKTAKAKASKVKASKVKASKAKTTKPKTAKTSKAGDKTKASTKSAPTPNSTVAPALADPGRCDWAGHDPQYIDYHDNEWGLPQKDDAVLFEKLNLEAFQAGLSWLTILRKRENFRKAFHQFDAARIARYTTKDVERLMNDEGIVRNRLKIEATIANAKALLALQKEQSFASFLWNFFPDGPIINAHAAMASVQAATEHSKDISKALKKRGFRFVGPTTVYAFMQSMGFVNDHMVTCRQYETCKRAQLKFKRPKRGRRHEAARD